jgi:hypothetical protein
MGVANRAARADDFPWRKPVGELCVRHRHSLIVGGSTTLSVTDRCREPLGDVKKVMPNQRRRTPQLYPRMRRYAARGTTWDTRQHAVSIGSVDLADVQRMMRAHSMTDQPLDLKSIRDSAAQRVVDVYRTRGKKSCERAARGCSRTISARGGRGSRNTTPGIGRRLPLYRPVYRGWLTPIYAAASAQPCCLRARHNVPKPRQSGRKYMTPTSGHFIGYEFEPSRELSTQIGDEQRASSCQGPRQFSKRSRPDTSRVTFSSEYAT